jgi:hypothetical protein
LEITLANLVTRLDWEDRRKSICNGGELSADDLLSHSDRLTIDWCQTITQARYISQSSKQAVSLSKEGQNMGQRQWSSCKVFCIQWQIEKFHAMQPLQHRMSWREGLRQQAKLINCLQIPKMHATETSRLKTREMSPISHRTPFQRVATSRGLRYLIIDFFLNSGETQHITSQKLILKNVRVIQPWSGWIGGRGRMKVDLFGVVRNRRTEISQWDP